MLCCHHPLVHIDELKFGSDAREFNPRRFVGNPGLKKDVSVGQMFICCRCWPWCCCRCRYWLLLLASSTVTKRFERNLG